MDKPKKEKYFCCRNCANKFASNINREDKNKKISESLKGKISPNKGKGKLYFCKKCNKKLHQKTKFDLCDKCLRSSAEYKNRLSKAMKGKSGGIRKKGGRGKQGWFNGIFCNSSWELAYLIYCNDHNIEVIRNKKGFPYIFEGQEFKFYPDFIVNGGFVEIKGYLNKKQEAKIKKFPHEIKVISKEEIKPYLSYAKEKYGENFIEIFKNNM